MSNYFTRSTEPSEGSSGDSSVIRAEFDAIDAGFNMLPSFSGNARKLVCVNAHATSLEATGYFQEGVWTPELKFGGSATGNCTLSGRYTRIGTRVMFEAIATMTGATTTTGDATLTLPVAADASAINTIVFIAMKDAAIAPTDCFGLIAAAGTAISLYSGRGITASSFTALTHTYFSSSSVLYLNGHYEV